MTRVTVCGRAFADAVEVLGLEAVDLRPDVVLVDLDDAEAAEIAATIPADVPRVALATGGTAIILRAIGSSVHVAASADPAAIGPHIAAVAPAKSKPATRVVVVTGIAGGVGRTLLTVNLAARLGQRASVLVLDATGTGTAGWWLGLTPGSWSDLESLAEELTTEHLAVVAAERERVRLIGGAGAIPTASLITATLRSSEGLADLVLIDAPLLHDGRTLAAAGTADHLLLVLSDAPVPLGALNGVAALERLRVVASRSRADRLAGLPVLRALPDDPNAVRAATRGHSAVTGALGRAYDDLAALLALDLG